MGIEYDDAKRKLTLQRRGLDMRHADEVFEGDTFTFEDLRKDYGEHRFITIGYLKDAIVVVVWTQRHANRRIISIRRANKNEREAYRRNAGL